MRNRKYFELRKLTESILLLRLEIEKRSQNNEDCESFVKAYDELCKERYLLEKLIIKHEYFVDVDMCKLCQCSRDWSKDV